MANSRAIEWCQHRFLWTARIETEQNARGEPLEFMPQKRYCKAATTRLNAYGGGPFCRIRLTNLPSLPCVYAITVESDLVYVGTAEDLAERWGLTQYGSIQPRNCYVGGQSTKCKINHLVLVEARKRSCIDLWRHETAKRREIEAQLIRRLDPPWNGTATQLLEAGASE